MALVCPACGCENRSVAKFCVECIAPLPEDFAPTQVVLPPSQAKHSMPSALAAFASAGPSEPAPLAWAPPLPHAGEPAPLHQGLWIGLALAGMLLMGTLGWLAAGGEIWPDRQRANEVAKPAQSEAADEPSPAPAEPVPASPPEPTAPPVPARRVASLFARCEGLGFISASRCRVDICTKSANRRLAECQPVLAQQRLMEEKRNPLMAD